MPFRSNFIRGVAFAVAVTCSTAQAQSEASALSGLSALPVAVSVVAPVMIIAAGASLTVAAVEVSAAGTVWVLERASDGARASIELGAQAANGVSVAVGAVVVVTAVASGWLLSTASEAIAFIPNEMGKALLYNERVTR